MFYYYIFVSLRLHNTQLVRITSRSGFLPYSKIKHQVKSCTKGNICLAKMINTITQDVTQTPWQLTIKDFIEGVPL